MSAEKIHPNKFILPHLIGCASFCNHFAIGLANGSMRLVSGGGVPRFFLIEWRATILADFFLGGNMQADLTQEIFSQGLEFLRKNRLPEASNAFRRAFKQDIENPRYLSYYGLILALQEENFQDGINFCRAAIQRAAYEPEFYVNLCKVFSKAGQRKKALEALLEGLNYDKSNALLKMEMKRMGIRRKPLLQFLPRDHFLNKAIGNFTYKLAKKPPRR